MRKILLSLLLALPAATAFAQGHNHSDQDDQPFYEGVWTVRLGAGRTARFELRDWAGTWRESGPSREMPAVCRGKKLPVTVQHSTTEALEFKVFGTSINRACPDTAYTFTPVDAKTLEAQLAGGGKATMKRAGR